MICRKRGEIPFRLSVTGIVPLIIEEAPAIVKRTVSVPSSTSRYFIDSEIICTTMSHLPFFFCFSTLKSYIRRIEK